MDSKKLVRLPQALEMTGLSRSTLYRYAQLGEFPKPVKLSDLGRCVAWRQEDIESWISSRQAA